jgi:acetyltransferase-like isoleucine patch superfamily enzyme
MSGPGADTGSVNARASGEQVPANQSDVGHAIAGATVEATELWRRDGSPGGNAATPAGLSSRLQHVRDRSGKLHRWLRASWHLRGCTKVGKWVRLTGKVYVRNWGEIIVGERVQIFAHYVPSVLIAFRGGRLEIGDRSTLNYGADISATKLVRIGADCGIGTHVMILDNDYHEVSGEDGGIDRSSNRPEGRPVIIGNHVWIANRVTILPGVSVGDGAVVGAGSVVMTDIPARTLAMGNPARVVKKF